MLADLRNHLFRHLQRLSLGFYERNRAGVLISRLTNDVEALDQLVTDGVTSLIQNTLTLARLGGDPLLPRLAARARDADGDARADRRDRDLPQEVGRSYRQVRETLGAVTATLAEDIAGMRVLQAFTRERAAQRELPPRRETYRAANQETVVQNGLYFPSSTCSRRSRPRSSSATAATSCFDGDMTIGVLSRSSAT